MNEALKTVIRAFQAEVQRGLALFQQHRGFDDIRSWHDRGLPRGGYLDAAERHEYLFHGIGCRLQLGPNLSIDWDFGHDGRMDGFDLWRLKLFLEERPDLQRILPLAALKQSFEEAVRDGSVISPWRMQNDNLYYLAGEQSN